MILIWGFGPFQLYFQGFSSTFAGKKKEARIKKKSEGYYGVKENERIFGSSECARRI